MGVREMDEGVKAEDRYDSDAMEVISNEFVDEVNALNEIEGARNCALMLASRGPM